jgi:hypothetical protein
MRRLDGVSLSRWSGRRRGGYVRHQWFYRGLVVAILVAVTTMLGCGTAQFGSVSPSIESSSTDAPPSTSAVVDSSTSSTSPPTTAPAPVTITASTTTEPAPPVTTTTPTTSADDLAEDYAVYSVLIQKMFIDDAEPGSTLIVIRESTVVPATDSNFILDDILPHIKDKWPELGDDIVSDFAAKNQTPLTLERRFRLSVNYALASEGDANEGWGPMSTAWDAFSAKYPGSRGSVNLSGIGFNKAKNRALFYLDGSTGNLVLLKKIAGRWTVQDEVEIWTA